MSHRLPSRAHAFLLMERRAFCYRPDVFVGDRLEQYGRWMAEGDPHVMWLAGLHVPESLLSALVQAASRKRGWPLDKSTLYTQVRNIQGSCPSICT